MAWSHMYISVGLKGVDPSPLTAVTSLED